MIKITFEVDEDFIIENASIDKMIDRLKDMDGTSAVKKLFDMIAFRELFDKMSKGKKEFTVRPDKLDAKSMLLYDNIISEIFMLTLFSEKDKPGKIQQ